MEAYAIVYYVLGSLWIIQAIVACGIIWKRQKYPCIRYRSPRLTLAAATGICILVALSLVRASNPELIPCAVVIWMTGIVYPLIYLTIIGRCIKLYFFYRISEAKLEDALIKMGGQSGLTMKRPAKFSFSKRSSRESVELRSLTQMNSAEGNQMSPMKYENYLENDWYYQRRYIATPNYMTTWLLIFLLLHSAVTAIVHLFSVRLNQSPAPTTDCYDGVDYIPRRAFCVLYGMIIIPLLVYLMRNVQDAYGIRSELATATLVNVLCDIILLVFTSWGKLRNAIDPDVSGLIWTIVPMVIIHILLVVAPLVESHLIDLRKGKPLSHPIMRGRSIVLDNTRESFESMLQNPSLMEQFKMYSVSDFTVECVLFYEACAKTKNQENSSPEALQEQFKEIYNTFIAPNSRFQVNLTDDTIRQIRILAKSDRWDGTMYQPAILEVKELMFRNTYPRFLVRYRRGDSHWDDLIEGA
ncbi:hypothetical protein K493DRAFT_371011 [Basidiobolus meristosporus CBS 931.73]|uniref:RGS domain-containing protein n=1 Tax=Basidiobolus meristosporus CBS 931.73 TaxID=1314790 RepID=A0A1Y1YFL4_9FUNG|nr:hypothetical protein K493DRAFT_371011 [Basidiobolus meristosporus CBS 931.73]|eukprot:ORX96394.1 hypothetical protein K493DRAFT_371011 [Basidiobolus meristosporus CBS 931.73]